MNRHRTFAALLFALGALGPCIADADVAALAPYSARIDAAAVALVADIRVGLDPRSVEIIDSIDFKAPARWDTSAVARYSPLERTRVVVFNSGLLAVTDWLTLAMMSEREGHEGCFVEYSNYLINVSGRNSLRVRRGKDHRPMAEFTEYARTTQGSCAGAHVRLDDVDSVEIRERILGGVIATVLLHEIAHHVLDHVESVPRSFMQERMREIAADQWAIRTAVRANYDLRTAVPLFLYLAKSGGGTLEDEIRSSHPSGLRRVRDLLVQTRTLLDDTDPTGARRMDAAIEDLNRTLR